MMSIVLKYWSKGRFICVWIYSFTYILLLKPLEYKAVYILYFSSRLVPGCFMLTVPCSCIVSTSLPMLFLGVFHPCLCFFVYYLLKALHYTVLLYNPTCPLKVIMSRGLIYLHALAHFLLYIFGNFSSYLNSNLFYYV